MKTMKAFTIIAMLFPQISVAEDSTADYIVPNFLNQKMNDAVPIVEAANWELEVQKNMCGSLIKGQEPAPLSIINSSVQPIVRLTVGEAGIQIPTPRPLDPNRNQYGESGYYLRLKNLGLNVVHELRGAGSDRPFNPKGDICWQRASRNEVTPTAGSVVCKGTTVAVVEQQAWVRLPCE